MTVLPPITVVVTTYLPEGEAGEARLEAMTKTLESWDDFLQYGGDLRLHIADDGSAQPLPGALFDRTFPGWTESRQPRQGIGASLNAGFRKAFRSSPLVAYFVDDWSLTGPIDLTRWAVLLMKQRSIGMVRLGPPHPDLTGTIKFLGEDGWALQIDRHHYAFGHRPALYHQRLIESYGWFEEGVNAYDCERLYAEGFCQKHGPEIVYALEYPWQHVESIELAGVVPE